MKSDAQWSSSSYVRWMQDRAEMLKNSSIKLRIGTSEWIMLDLCWVGCCDLLRCDAVSRRRSVYNSIIIFRKKTNYCGKRIICEWCLKGKLVENPFRRQQTWNRSSLSNSSKRISVVPWNLPDRAVTNTFHDYDSWFLLWLSLSLLDEFWL